MRLPAGTAGFRPRPHFLWAGGGFPLPAFFAAIREASVPSGEVTVYLVKIVLWAANGLFKAFFACCGRFHRCGCASSGCGCGWPACVMRRVPAPSGEPGPAQTHTYINEAATLPFRNVAAVWALRPVVRLSLSVRSRRCPAGRCRVRRRRRYSNCRSVPLRPPRRRAGSQRSRSPSAVRSCRPKPRSSSSCPSTAGARTRRRPPLPT